MTARRWIRAALLLGVTAVPGEAQLIVVDGTLQPDTLARSFALKFTVPESPAFELLDPGSSDLFRPMTVREATAMVTSFVGDDGLQVPEAVGIELAPAMLVAGPDLTLTEYADHDWLYRLRLSLSATTEESERTRKSLAVGLRIPLKDEGDLRTNTAFLMQATEVTREINDIVAAARRRAGPPPAPIELTDEEEARIAALGEGLKEDWQQGHWNADRLDVALAARVDGAADEIEGSSTELGEIAAWLVFAEGFGEWGQLLLGGRWALDRPREDEVSEGRDLESDWSVSSRFYVGAATTHFFLEAAAKDADPAESEWLLNLGFDFRITDDAWISGTGGLAWPDGGSSEVVSEFRVKLGLPGLGP